jgi:hypothetical protein
MIFKNQVMGLVIGFQKVRLYSMFLYAIGFVLLIFPFFLVTTPPLAHQIKNKLQISFKEICKVIPLLGPLSSHSPFFNPYAM